MDISTTPRAGPMPRSSSQHNQPLCFSCPFCLLAFCFVCSCFGFWLFSFFLRERHEVGLGRKVGRIWEELEEETEYDQNISQENFKLKRIYSNTLVRFRLVDALQNTLLKV